MSGLMNRPPGWRWGDLIPSRGHARCYGCHRPWNVTRGHVSVSYSPTRSQSTLCPPCWEGSTVDERVEAHLWACDEWAWMEARSEVKSPEHVPAEVAAARIEQAIRAGDLRMWATPDELDGGALGLWFPNATTTTEEE